MAYIKKYPSKKSYEKYKYVFCENACLYNNQQTKQ